MPDPQAAPGESVMKGEGYYSGHSRPQQAAAAVGFPYLERAAREVPLPARAGPLLVGDFGCAGGRNEMAPLGLAVDALRARDAAAPLVVVHTDLPQNDWAALFAALDGGDSYTAGRTHVYPMVVGRTLYGPCLPDGALTLAWTAITVQWMSAPPCPLPHTTFSNLATGDPRRLWRDRAARDWEVFLTERHRELVPGGQLVVVGGASAPDGLSGAEGLFGMIDAELAALTGAGAITGAELEAIAYPTWNRTPAEFLAPFAPGGALHGRLAVLEHRADVSDDAETFPQWSRDHDAAAFAAAYGPFVRAVTEPAFFRSLAPGRTPDQRRAVVEGFYAGLERRIAADPQAAAARWHTVTLRIARVR